MNPGSPAPDTSSSPLPPAAPGSTLYPKDCHCWPSGHSHVTCVLFDLEVEWIFQRCLKPHLSAHTLLWGVTWPLPIGKLRPFLCLHETGWALELHRQTEQDGSERSQCGSYLAGKLLFPASWKLSCLCTTSWDQRAMRRPSTWTGSGGRAPFKMRETDGETGA